MNAVIAATLLVCALVGRPADATEPDDAVPVCNATCKHNMQCIRSAGATGCELCLPGGVCGRGSSACGSLCESIDDCGGTCFQCIAGTCQQPHCGTPCQSYMQCFAPGGDNHCEWCIDGRCAIKYGNKTCGDSCVPGYYQCAPHGSCPYCDGLGRCTTKNKAAAAGTLLPGDRN